MAGNCHGPCLLLRRAVYLTLLTISVLAPASGCCEVPWDQQVSTPEHAWSAMHEAITKKSITGSIGNPKLCRYLLARRIRQQVTPNQLSMAWSSFRRLVAPLLNGSRLLKVEYLSTAPLPDAADAAVLEVEYKLHDKLIREKVLLILEMAASDYGDRFPQWRFVYPYNAAGFQRGSELLRELTPDDADGEAGD